MTPALVSTAALAIYIGLWAEMKRVCWLGEREFSWDAINTAFTILVLIGCAATLIDGLLIS